MTGSIQREGNVVFSSIGSISCSGPAIVSGGVKSWHDAPSSTTEPDDGSRSIATAGGWKEERDAITQAKYGCGMKWDDAKVGGW